MTTGIAGMIAALAAPAAARPLPPPAVIDAQVAAALAATHARSLALAVIDRGRVTYVRAYGVRTAAGAPLGPDSILYGASLTKAVFAAVVLRLVDEGRVDLDRPIAASLPRPLGDYGDADTVRRYGDFTPLAGDPRWLKITPRILLTHSSGLANFAALEPDGVYRLHFDPGSRYAYSGAGLLLLQMMLERGMGLDVAAEAQRRLFDPLGMTDTALTWRDDFAGREATGWTIAGEAPGHAHQSKVRMAGSMDTTIADMARFAAALVRGGGLSAKSRAALYRRSASPAPAITTASQFPTFQDELPPARRHAGLSAGLGVVTFRGPQGAGFMKGGHNDQTGNSMVCLARRQRCVVLMGPDVRAEAAYPALVRFILGETGFPWGWEYGDMTFWQPGQSAG